MRRFQKLLGMIFIFCIVFFIICDEKGYKIGFENNQIVLNKIEKKSKLIEAQFDPNAVYKNSNLININYEFEKPKSLRESNGVDRKYIAKLEKEKKLEEEKIKEQENSRNRAFEDDTILSAFEGGENTGTTEKEVKQNTGTAEKEAKQNAGTTKKEVKQSTGTTKKEVKESTGTAKKTEEPRPVIVYYPIEKYEHSRHPIKLIKGAEIPKFKIDKYSGKDLLSINLLKGKELGPLYKNSNRIKIYSGFENIIALRNSDGIDEEFLLRQKNRKPTIISLNDNDTISSAFQNNSEKDEDDANSGYDEQSNANPDFSKNIEISNVDMGINDSEYNIQDIDEIAETGIVKGIMDNENVENSGSGYGFMLEGDETQTGEIIEESMQEIKYKVEKYELQNHSIDLSKGEELEKILVKLDEYKPQIHTINIKNGEKESIKRPESNYHSINLSRGKEPEKVLVKLDKYEPGTHMVEIKNGVMTKNTVEENITKENTSDADKITIEDIQYKENVEDIEDQNIENSEETDYIMIEKPELFYHANNLSKGIKQEIVLVKIEKYQHNKHHLDLKKGKITKHNFIVENTESVEQNDNSLSDEMLNSLLENEEIDINTLESENDEFLQKIFEKTKDRDVMNLIVENYLNEYQFVKAKNFIENLPDMYREELKPSLNLRVAFNSFPLSSKTNIENLSEIIQNYSSKNEIPDEDKKRYLGVITLMDRDYDKFFEISTGFTSENHKLFTLKLQGYKDQISKQMGMPEYYFDTLVALELFNQGLFQPAKILALYSLQQNANYILPYQVLAYANFLTNSRDTSIEYLKKLMDIDPNNADKYRFLMGVAFYRDERYEQSVVMFSMIKDESLRLDTQRYLINDYIKLDQKNKLIASRNKLLGYENLVASDFYTYFYETFFHPYSEGRQFNLYAYDTELANKMLRVCSVTLQNEDKAVCTYGTIGRNIAIGQFDGLEQYLLNLATEYPQGYLYQALGDYYIQQGDLEKAKAYLIKAISLTQNKSERSQIKKLLQDTM